jgi:tRNA modification GTPase
MYTEDTIAAVATPPGQGGVGIVRVSGPLSPDIAERVFRRRTAGSWRSHRLYGGVVLDTNQTVIDQGLAVLMRKPRSYTGEDVLEIHCHGSPVLLRSVLAATLAAGARLAEPGEFTRRAFLNGRIDLTQAEAVIDLVRARTETAAVTAAGQLCGQLSSHLESIRGDLLCLKALLEVQIDFADEALATACAGAMGSLLHSYQRGKRVRDGVRAVLIGKPNVGKSSLLNALLGEERAIVTAVPGTTRDSIEESVDIGGVSVVLTDTAGLRDDAHAEIVERLGMQRTLMKISEADVVLAVFDSSRPLDAEDERVLAGVRGKRHVIVLNKIDLPAALSADGLGAPQVRVSARQRLGLDDLRAVLEARLDEDAPVDDGVPLLTNLRHHDALRKAVYSLDLARQALLEARPADLVAVDVQESIDRLGEITGAITVEDVLDQIFREFCIGK